MTTYSSEEKQTKVSLDATVRKGFGRNAQTTVSMLGLVSGSADTIAEAKAKAAAVAEDILRNAFSGPAFAVDDDGSLIVAVPMGEGSQVYRITGQSARCVSSTASNPEDSLSRVHHYTMIGR